MKEGGGGRGGSLASPTQHLLQNSHQGFSQQHTHLGHAKGSSRPPFSCSLNHGFGFPWLMVPVRAKPRPHPHNLVFSPLPASCLPPGMQVWKQPLPEFSTEPSPFPFGGGQCWHLSGFRVSTGLFETSGAPLRYSKGDVCPLPNRMMRDVQKDNAHPRPALVVPHLFWLRTEKRTQDIPPCSPCKPFSQICEGNSRTNKNESQTFPSHSGKHELIPLQRQPSCVPYPVPWTGNGRSGSRAVMRGDLRPWEIGCFMCINH